MKSCMQAVIAVVMTCLMILSLTGCNELQSELSVAHDAITSAAAILQPVNPDYAAKLTKVANDIAEVENLEAQYNAASATAKPGIAGQVQAVTSTMTANLKDILAAVNVSNPEMVEYISVGVAIANSVIVNIVNRLPSGPAPPVIAAAAVVGGAAQPALPTVPYKTYKDLRKAWNDKVSTKFPNSKI